MHLSRRGSWHHTASCKSSGIGISFGHFVCRYSPLIWSLTSPRVKRASGSKNYRSSPQEDFCNNIRAKADMTNAKVARGRLLNPNLMILGSGGHQKLASISRD
jgi:hypothetical protein